MQQIGVGCLIFYVCLRIVFEPLLILGAGSEILVKLPFHTAGRVMSLAPGFFLIRLGLLLVLRGLLLLVLREIIRKREPVRGIISKIGLGGLCGALLCVCRISSLDREAVRLDLCCLKGSAIVCRVDYLKVPGSCLGKRDLKPFIDRVIFLVSLFRYPCPVQIVTAIIYSPGKKVLVKKCVGSSSIEIDQLYLCVIV